MFCSRPRKSSAPNAPSAAPTPPPSPAARARDEVKGVPDGPAGERGVLRERVEGEAVHGERARARQRALHARQKRLEGGHERPGVLRAVTHAHDLPARGALVREGDVWGAAGGGGGGGHCEDAAVRLEGLPRIGLELRAVDPLEAQLAALPLAGLARKGLRGRAGEHVAVERRERDGALRGEERRVLVEARGRRCADGEQRDADPRARARVDRRRRVELRHPEPARRGEPCGAGAEMPRTGRSPRRRKLSGRRGSRPASRGRASAPARQGRRRSTPAAIPPWQPERPRGHLLPQAGPWSPFFVTSYL